MTNIIKTTLLTTILIVSAPVLANAYDAYSVTPYVTTGTVGAGSTRGNINMAENEDRSRLAARYNSDDYTRSSQGNPDRMYNTSGAPENDKGVAARNKNNTKRW